MSALWKAMREARGTAYQQHYFCNEEVLIAAEIRALADWLVPDEPEPPNSFEEEGYVPMRLREERQRLRGILLAEAEQATNPC